MCQQPVATYTENDTNFKFIEGRRIYWAGGVPPTDVPKCGYDNSKCTDSGERIFTSSH